MAKKNLRKVFALLLSISMTLGLIAVPAFAEDNGEAESVSPATEETTQEKTPEPADPTANPVEDPEGTPEPEPEPDPIENAVYVSEVAGSGTADGTKGNPYTSLAEAVGTAKDGDTIVLLSNITVTELARIVDKNLTITSEEGQSYIITRGDDFKTDSDNARSWYNPAMIEVTVPNGPSASVTLKNIVLDDAGKHMGTVFAQASDAAGHDDNTKCVQDAMVAAYGTDSATAEIIVGSGAVLKNFGGMSAVRVTGGAKLTMEEGSSILDDAITD